MRRSSYEDASSHGQRQSQGQEDWMEGNNGLMGKGCERCQCKRIVRMATGHL